MSIRPKIKGAPRALRTKPLEIVWPGDSAVIAEESDLLKWCWEGGKAGLNIRQGEVPDVIEAHILTTPELTEVSAAKGANKLGLAARFGLDRVPGFVLPRSDSINGVSCHPESVLDELTSEDMEHPLHWGVLLWTPNKAKGIALDEHQIERLEGPDAIIPVPLGYAVGAHILAASFRARRRDA